MHYKQKAPSFHLVYGMLGRSQRSVSDVTLCNELGSYLLPSDAVSQGLHLGEALTSYTKRWFACFVARQHDLASVPDLGDGWISLLTCFEEPLHPPRLGRSDFRLVGAALAR